MASFGYQAPPPSGGAGEITFIITESGGKLYIDDQEQQALSVLPGMTYKFDLSDSSLSANAFKLSSTEDGTHGGGSAFTSGVTEVGTAGSAGASLTWDVPVDAPTEMNYYNQNTAAAGASTGVVDAAGGGGGGITAVANFNALPAVSTVAGQIHYVTATGLLYFSNGVQYSLMGSEDPDLGTITAAIGPLDHAAPAGGDSTWGDVTTMVTGDEAVTETVAGDPYYNNVSFHFDFEQTTPVDHSYFGVGAGGTRTVTMGNGAVTSTTQKKWGSKSLAITGGTSSNHYMHVSNGASLGTGNFTLEGWIYPTSLPSGQDTCMMFSKQVSGDSGGLIFWKNSNNSLVAQFWHGMNHSGSGTQGYMECEVIGALTVNKWSYFAFERYGKKIGLTVYNDDTLVGQSKSGSSRFSGVAVTTPGNHPLRTHSSFPTVPADAFVFGQGSLTGGAADVMEGYLDDWRLTAGVSRYRGATAPIPTAAFPITTAQRVETIPERKASKVVTNIGSVIRPIGSGDPYWDAVSLYMNFNTTPFEDLSNNKYEFEEEQSGDLSSQGTATTDYMFGTGSFEYGDGANANNTPAGFHGGGHGLYLNESGPGYFKGSDDWTVEIIYRSKNTYGTYGKTETAFGGAGGEYLNVIYCGSVNNGSPANVGSGWDINRGNGGRIEGNVRMGGPGGSGYGGYSWTSGFPIDQRDGWWSYFILERKGNLIHQHHWLLESPVGGLGSYAGMPWVISKNNNPATNFAGAYAMTSSHYVTYSHSSNTEDANQKFSIGRSWNSQYSSWDRGTNGFLDSIRITNGVARFGGENPPKPTAAGSLVASQMRWPSGNKNFSANWQGGIEHVGKGNSSLPASTDYTFGTGALTIEGWIYMSGATLENIFWDFRLPSGADTQDQLHFSCYWNGTDYNIKVYLGNTAIITSSTGIDLERWYHVALTRQATNPYQFELFIDATSKGTASNSTSLTAGALSLGSYYKGTDSQGFIPNSTTPLDFAGFLDDFKVTKGTVRTIPAGHADGTGYPATIDAGGITHTTGSTGISGTGLPMATTTLSGTTANPTSDETGSVLTYGIKDDQVTVTAGPIVHTPSHAGIKPATEAGLVVNPTTGNISITSPSDWEGDTVSFQGSISDGVNSVYKTISWIVRPNFNIIASSGDPLVFNANGFTVFRFHASGTVTVSQGSGSMEWYCIGGGGPGGRFDGGGGGGGAVRTGTESVSTTGGNGAGVYTLTVAAKAGTWPTTVNGYDSSIAFGGSTGTITSNGGGAGGDNTWGNTAVNLAYTGNGSGGGSSRSRTTLIHTSGAYGNDGGVCAATSHNAAGGGGGAGGAGHQGGTGNLHDLWGDATDGDDQGGKGGAATYIDWDGTSRPYAGGGGGGSYYNGTYNVANWNWCGEGSGPEVYSAQQAGQGGYSGARGGGIYNSRVPADATFGDLGPAGEAFTGGGGGGTIDQVQWAGTGGGSEGVILIRF